MNEDSQTVEAAFGAVVRRMREARSWTAADLATRAKLSATTMYGLEQRGMWTSKTFNAIAGALGITPLSMLEAVVVEAKHAAKLSEIVEPSR